MDFIGEFFLEDVSICDSLIDFFHNSDYGKENQYQGHFYNKDLTKYINHRQKKSTDLDLNASLYLDYPIIEKYIKNLDKISKKYVKLYPASNLVDSWGILEDPKMQYYKPGEGYFVSHAERSGPDMPSVLRHLVFMTYLNTVTDGGGTEFVNYNKVTNAVKGKTLIWPSDWTHLHRGITSPSQDKYILTGWFSYKPNEYE